MVSCSNPVKISAPFPYFGGKSAVAADVWRRFGDLDVYIEPFAGSLAVLLGRPQLRGREVVNDIDGLITNFWRAVRSAPSPTAQAASFPISELDLHAIHDWLFSPRSNVEALRGDPEHYDPRVAGWWVWGMSCAMGNSFSIARRCRSIPRVHGSGNGIHRKSLEAACLDGRCQATRANIEQWFGRLADRLRHVRICCGDWSRMVRPSMVSKGLTGVFLDPPYGVKDRSDCYGYESRTVAQDVRAWALANGDRPNLRIALCGYAEEHELPGWERFRWTAHGGFGNMRRSTANVNRHKETIWFSPSCLRA